MRLQVYSSSVYRIVCLILIFVLMLITVSGCGDSTSSTREEGKNVDKGNSSELTDDGGARCSACVSEDVSDDKIFDGETVIKGRVIISPLVDKDVVTGTNIAEPDNTDEVVEYEVIQLSPDPAIVETIVGKKPDLDLDFINQKGKPVNLSKDYPGKTLVITSIYTTCPKAEMCPRLTSDMGWLARQIPDELRNSIQLILVSFDPVQDIPPVLKAFGMARGVDFEVTDMLTGDIHDVRQLLEFELEVPIDVEPYTNAITAHAMMVHVINADGYIVAERTATVTESIELIAKEMIRAVEIPFTVTQESKDSDG